jgi:hypothetical protein
VSGAAAVRLAHGARRAAAALAVAAAALACAPAHPQEAVDRELRAERTVEAGRLQPGAPIRMTVRATAPAGATIRLPALDRTLGPFDVRDVRTLPAADGGAALEATLVGWDAGALELPEMKVEATLADGSARTATVPARQVELVSLVGEDMPLTELASGIRGPVEIATRAWLWWLAAGVAAAAALAFTWWLRRRGHAEPAEPPVPPAEWARRELDRLDADALPARGEVDAFFVRLSGIVRTYVEGRFAIAAPDRTTQEFLREAARHPDLAGGHDREIGAFLRTADMVKFAAARPPVDACAGAMRSMRAFVEATAPRADEGDAAAAPGGAAGAPAREPAPAAAPGGPR